jgi:hypothetical protein
MERQHIKRTAVTAWLGMLASTTFFLSCDPWKSRRTIPPQPQRKSSMVFWKWTICAANTWTIRWPSTIPSHDSTGAYCPVAGNPRNLQQQAYQILVASEPNKLEPETADLWDSGKVVSDQCTHVPYDGSALTTRQHCYWRVRVWDKFGLAFAVVATQQWRMGLLEAVDWEPAQWIGLNEDTHDSPLLFRPFQTQDMNEPGDAPDLCQPPAAPGFPHP